MERIARLMEWFWLVLAVLTAGWAVWELYTHGWDSAKHLTWFPLVCAAMYLYRRFTRKRMTAWAERENSKVENAQGQR